MINRMAEKVKIVNDSMVCLAMHELLKKGKECRFIG